MSLASELKSYAAEIGINRLGISVAQRAAELHALLASRRQEGRQSPFEHVDLLARTDPGLVLPGAKTLVSIGLAYPHQLELDAVPVSLSGRVARVAWVSDYHRIMHQALAQLAAFLARAVPGLEYRAMVDTGPLVDRAVAHQSGLGWYGKNGSLLAPGLGSWLVLGELLLNVAMEPDDVSPEQCGSCCRCLNACPAGALAAPYAVNPFRCLSLITQTRGIIPREVRPLLENRIYGCDTCQEACPRNASVKANLYGGWQPRKEWAAPDLIRLLRIGRREFQEQYGLSSAAWCGRQTLRRNAAVALGNLRDPEAFASLAGSLEDASPVVRVHAAWALGQLGGRLPARALSNLLKREQDIQVQAETRQALAEMG